MPTVEQRQRLWVDVLGYVKERVSDTQFKTWFEKTRCTALDDGKIALEVANTFCMEWLKRQYTGLLREAISAAGGPSDPEIEMTISDEASDEASDEVSPDPIREQTSVASTEPGPIETPAPVPAPPPVRVVQDANLQRNLNADYTFGNFVVGPSNRLGHAVSMAIIEQPGRAYNPMFIHGGLGLGKTHLMQSVCHELLDRQPNLRMLYLPCETFINEFITAISDRDVESFRQRYREVDVLLIDDIHFLAHKDHSQEEFFHTFNALYNDHKQIILSSDSPPKEIPTLEERLVSRFKWGIVCEIEPPTFETRMAIIRKKAARFGVRIPDDVVELLAGSIRNNIRELEGAVTTLAGRAKILGSEISVEIARSAIAGLAGPQRKRVSIDRIIDVVTEHFGVRLSDLQSKKRNQSIALPRQVCMYLGRKYTNHSLAEIGGYFGGRDHSTVLYGTDKITRTVEINAELRLTVNELSRQLEA